MSDGEWKTLRVRKDAWEQAQEQRQEAGRTWSEQIVRGEDAGGLDVDALAEDRQEQLEEVVSAMCGDTATEESIGELAQEVGKAVELAEQARDNTDEIKKELGR